MYSAEAGWAAIEPPQIYAREYDEFRRGWRAAFGAIYFDFPGHQTFAIARVRWRLARHSLARRKRNLRVVMGQALDRINQSLGTVIVDSIAISTPECRRAADTLRDEVADAEPP